MPNSNVTNINPNMSRMYVRKYVDVHIVLYMYVCMYVRRRTVLENKWGGYFEGCFMFKSVGEFRDPKILEVYG